MKALKLVAVIIITIAFVACKKDKTVPIPAKLEGTYTGQFNYNAYGATVYDVPLQGNVTVIFSGAKYQSTSPFTQFGASAAGSFVVNDDKLVTFSDSTAHFANFNWGLILNGKYNYTTKGDSLILINKGSSTLYTYHLKKQ